MKMSFPYLEPDFITFSKDVDECSEDKHNCSPKATCENTEGSFKCKCNDDYQGDGKSCVGEQFLLKNHSPSRSYFYAQSETRMVAMWDAKLRHTE